MPPAKFVWTDELVQHLITLWNGGASAAELQARIGAPSRSAVIGKVHRLRRDGVKLRGLEQTAPSVSVRAAAAAPQAGDENALAKPKPDAVHFLDAVHGQCRW